MTDDPATATHSADSGPTAPLGGFTRSRRDRMIAGVAGGVAERLDVDPLIIRAAFVILAVAGGSGLLLYVLGWLLLPEEGEHDSIAGQALDARPWESRRTRHLGIAALVALVLFGFSGAFRPWHWSLGRPVVAIAVVLAIAAYSRHRNPGPGSAVAGPSAPTTAPVPGFGPTDRPAGDRTAGDRTAGDPTLVDVAPGEGEGRDEAAADPTVPFDRPAYPGAYVAGSFGSGGHPSPWSPPAEPRQPSLIPPLLAALAALAGVSAVIAATSWVSVPLPAVLAVALLLSLAALVAGALRGRFVGATLISLAVAGVLVLSAAVPHPLAGGIGQRTWHPVGLSDLQSSYRLGTGQATLDLSGIPPTGRPVRVSVGTGDLAVIVPVGTAVQVRERAAIGGTDVLGDRQGGVSVDRSSFVAGTAGATGDPAPFHLDLQVGIGTIEVRRAGS